MATSLQFVKEYKALIHFSQVGGLQITDKAFVILTDPIVFFYP